MVPNQYVHNKKYLVTMTVRGFDRDFAVGDAVGDPHDVGDAVTEPGLSLLHNHLPTHVALWFLVNGLFGDLRQPCNWTLGLVEREKAAS